MEKYIIEREDYLTVEEYNKLKSKLDEIYDLINRMSTEDDLRTIGCYFTLIEFEKEYRLMYCDSYTKNVHGINIDKDILKILEVPIKDYYPDVNMWNFFLKLNEIDINDILDMKHKLDYYKDKLINVQHFDEHQYFRDTYDVIDNLK